MTKDERHKIAVITGSAGGIGDALMDVFCARGYVAVGYDIVGSGNLDVTDIDDAREFFKHVAKEYGDIEVLVNNAAINSPASITDRRVLKDYERIFDVNVFGAINMSHHALTQMKQGSAIINIASKSAHVSLPNRPLYCASKGAIVALTKQMAIDLAPNIRVNSVSPGTINTGMKGSYIADQNNQANLLSKIPLGKMGRPYDVAKLVADIAENKYITGQDFIIDGGYTAQ